MNRKSGLVVTALAALLLQCTVDSQTSVDNSRQSHSRERPRGILNGKKLTAAEKVKYKAVGAIYDGDGKFKCTGTVVAKGTNYTCVLTAAHCLNDPYTFALGDNGATLKKGGFRVVDTHGRWASHMQPMNNFDKTSFDIGMIKLEGVVDVTPLPLAENKPVVGTTATIIGLSLSDVDSPDYGIARIGQTKITRLEYRELTGFTNVFTDSIPGLDQQLLGGDSGSPIFKKGDTKILGVASISNTPSFKGEYKKGEVYFAGYPIVAEHRYWIEATAKEFCVNEKTTKKIIVGVKPYGFSFSEKDLGKRLHGIDEGPPETFPPSKMFFLGLSSVTFSQGFLRQNCSSLDDETNCTFRVLDEGVTIEAKERVEVGLYTYEFDSWSNNPVFASDAKTLYTPSAISECPCSDQVCAIISVDRNIGCMANYVETSKSSPSGTNTNTSTNTSTNFFKEVESLGCGWECGETTNTWVQFGNCDPVDQCSGLERVIGLDCAPTASNTPLTLIKGQCGNSPAAKNRIHKFGSGNTESEAQKQAKEKLEKAINWWHLNCKLTSKHCSEVEILTPTKTNGTYQTSGYTTCTCG